MTSFESYTPGHEIGSRAYSSGTVLAKSSAMTTRHTAQALRRAARWHAWLTSPQCTFQDRENFQRWCSDSKNAAAYVALCTHLALDPARLEIDTH
jgi:ferric-dicitrate binding protein FerR (iron transport regulator)